MRGFTFIEPRENPEYILLVGGGGIEVCKPLNTDIAANIFINVGACFRFNRQRSGNAVSFKLLWFGNMVVNWQRKARISNA